MYASMCQNMNGITPSNGNVKLDYNEAMNVGKETSSTDKSENEKMNKTPNDPFSVRVCSKLLYKCFMSIKIRLFFMNLVY